MVYKNSDKNLYNENTKRNFVYGDLKIGDLSSLVTSMKKYKILASENIMSSARSGSLTVQSIVNELGEDYLRPFYGLVDSGVFVLIGQDEQSSLRGELYKLNESLDISDLENRIFSERDFSREIPDKYLKKALFFKEELGVDKFVSREDFIDAITDKLDVYYYGEIISNLFKFGCIKKAFKKESVYVMSKNKSDLIELEAKKRGISYVKKPAENFFLKKPVLATFSVLDPFWRSVREVHKKINEEEKTLQN